MYFFPYRYIEIANYTEFRQVSLLFVRDVRKAPNRGLEGSLLPLDFQQVSGIPRNSGIKFDNFFGEKSASLIRLQANLKKS